MRTRAGSSGSNSRLARVIVSYNFKCMDASACAGRASDREVRKDGRSQRWSLADNCPADAAGRNEAVHGPAQWASLPSSSRVSPLVSRCRSSPDVGADLGELQTQKDTSKYMILVRFWI